MAKPYELKAFAKQHKKNDKIDAKLIADVLIPGTPMKEDVKSKKTPSG